MLRVVEQALAVRDRALRTARLRIELARLQATRTARLLAIAVGLGVVALVLVLYAVGFLFAAAAVALDEALPLWASLLVVAVALLLAAVVVGLVAARVARRAGPERSATLPAPAAEPQPGEPDA